MEEQDDGQEISRRDALKVAAGAGVGMTALGPLMDQAAARPRSGTSPKRRRGAPGHPRTIMLVRHGEKPDGPGPPFGVLPSGEQDLESLSVRGWTRAGALVGLFAPEADKPRRGLRRPTALFAADPGGSGSKRPLQTISPLADRLGKPIRVMDIEDEDRDAAAIAGVLLATPGAPLGSWQHRMIPPIARYLGKVHPAVPKKWPDERYDLVWVFTRRGDGSWRFRQVPQLLLAGDESTIIT
jgi:hypothetical protein